MAAGTPAESSRHPLPHQWSERGLRIGVVAQSGFPISSEVANASSPTQRGQGGGRPFSCAAFAPTTGDTAARAGPRVLTGRLESHGAGRRDRALALESLDASPSWRTRSSGQPRRPDGRVRSRNRRARSPPSTPRPLRGVTLASLHAAKGLKWDVVIPRRGSAMVSCRSRWLRPGPRSMRNGACSMSASPAPAETCT